MFFFSKKLRNYDIKYPDNKTPPLITLSIRWKDVPQFFSISPLISPRFPRRSGGFIYGVAIAGISLSGKKVKDIGGRRSEELRAEWKRNDGFLYQRGGQWLCLGKSPGTNDAFNNFATSSRLLPVIFPFFSVFPFFVILLPFIPLPFFRANVPSSTCISDGVIPSYFFSWQLNWISIIGLGMLVLSSSGIDRRFCGFLHRIFFVSFFHECVTMQCNRELSLRKLS